MGSVILWATVAWAGTPLCDALLVDTPSPVRVQAALTAGGDARLPCDVASAGVSVNFEKGDWFLGILFPPYFAGKLLLGGEPYTYTSKVPPLVLAASRRNPEVVVLLLQAGADPNEKKPLQVALLDAISWKSIDVVRVLVAGGARLNDPEVLPVHVMLDLAEQPGLWDGLVALGIDVNMSSYKPALYEAVEQGRLEVVKRLLKAGANPNGKDSYHPLNVALKAGDVMLSELLVEAGARPQPDALWHAAHSQNIDLMRWVLGLGVAVDGEGAFGETALNVGAAYGNEVLVEFLLEAGADPTHRGFFDRLPIISAVHGGNPEVVALLVKHGASLEGETRGMTLLEVAVLQEDAELAKFLIAQGAQLGVGPGHPRTVLHRVYHNEGAIGVAVSLGNPVDAGNKDGQTPLMVATMACSEHGIRDLIRAGASIAARDPLGRTVAHYAIGCSESTMKLLLSLGASFSAPDQQGWTPLHLAATQNARQLELLVKLGAGLEAQDKDGNTALMLALRQRQPSDTILVMQRLMVIGARVDAVDAQGQNVLNQAVMYGEVEVVRFLTGIKLQPAEPLIFNSDSQLDLLVLVIRTGLPYTLERGLEGTIASGAIRLARMAIQNGYPVAKADLVVALKANLLDIADLLDARLGLTRADYQEFLEIPNLEREARQWLRKKKRSSS